ncbi:UDP-N-acetylglucosamine--N-acetylmuramyl-(pentapeptide) pyrophosphoryl-undecaprenol N-acetylglucosamine transferase [Dermatophilus congolensis]|uniref:UDP-N-acetylglucosamine--N-acetylmuramyl-(pentapeptide) pyrophosphoryl-undecaprenol N-acetylglucosamine transferase n=1 Tax=Dermatophilus congolensis TaxID=1863 RepID=A0AA46GZU6_9MICO|nr:undecaprenyldiphospho-muramoylpentapeptide beta-N-acetylglucosaminyltransferase [Dermatophilus congolensis]STD06048.1 UDP-N-acetylglucosamine--N-acetylmuramyl-(pentapeptide) pyrophosphoryl-undecaprenol N-acetylglucosamine transferase [Dermatophilus congolensis]
MNMGSESVKMPASVLLAGGGSAGHVSPLLATADALRRRDPHVRITALGTREGLEARLVPARGYDLAFVPKVAFPRRPNRAALKFPGKLVEEIRAADRAILDTEAEVVVGFGGYVSTPAYLAAKRRGVPIVVHEGNARPGLANKAGSRMTEFVATTFSSTSLPNARYIGMPMRAEITRLDRAALRDEALAHFGLRGDAPVLLVTGGSLGAKRLNDAFSASVRDLQEAGVQVLHLAGGGKGFEPDLRVDGPAYRVLEYADRIELAYAAADLVVCRSGANTVCELTAVGLPAIFVPLPIGNGEQRINADDVVAVGGALLVDDAQVCREWVTGTVIPLMRDRERLSLMADASARVGVRTADDQLVDMIIAAGAKGAVR